MDPRPPKLSVGILTYNRRDAVLAAIQSVYDQGIPDIEVVVVDSASKDGTSEAIKERFSQVKYIRLPRNLGCPEGRNHVFANCTGKYIINLDDDGCLGEDAIKKVIEAFESDSSIGIIAMRQCYTDEPESGRVFGEDGIGAVQFYGGVSAFRREMLDRIGCYPDDFFLYYEEDYLALLAMDAGYRIVSRPDIIMWHPKVGGSGIRGVRKESGLEGNRWDYYRFRNALLVTIRLYPGWLMVKYLILRLGSYALISIRRRSFHKYLCAAAFVLCHLPTTLITRKPCSKGTVKKYFRLRY